MAFATGTAVLLQLPCLICDRRGGQVVNIPLSEVAVPHLAPYTASKYALVGLSDTLRSKWRTGSM
jgi:NAD(P)-dependent dehydrogenase (short-subunit alcohol dehydrogenase family)